MSNVLTKLNPGDSLTSPDGSLKLTMQETDGNLVLKRVPGNTVIWASGTDTDVKGDEKKAYAIMQGDGNFVIYKVRDNTRIWATGTNKQSGKSAVLQNDGLFILTSSNKEIWSTRSQLGAGKELPSELQQRILSPDGKLSLTMEGGNLVLRALSDGEILWTSGTTGNSNARLKMQSDGNLVILDGDDEWHTATYGKGVRSLSLLNDRFVLCNAFGGVIWDSASTQLIAEEKLNPDQDKFSPDGTLILTMQSDGNLVIYKDNKAKDKDTWSTGTHGNPGAYVHMQGDGNLVIKKSNIPSIWHTGTYNLPNGGTPINKQVRRATLHNNGDFVLYARDGSVMWKNTKTSVKGTQPLNIFTTRDNFAFTIDLTRAVTTNTNVRYTVTDYFDNPIVKNTIIPAWQRSVTVNDGQRSAGHYIVKVEIPGESIISEYFAVVIPYQDRPQYANPGFVSPFATDIAFSWYSKYGFAKPTNFTPKEKKSLNNDYSRAVQLSGVTWVRERMSWADIAGPFDSGKDTHDAYFKPTPPNNYKTYKTLVAFIGTPTRERLDKHLKDIANFLGLNTLDNTKYSMTQADQDDWIAITEENKNRGYMLPDHLEKIYNFAVKYGARYKGYIDMWEVWNEQEYDKETSAYESADRYSAVLKAASIGFHDAGIPVTMGGMVSHNIYALYHENMFENDIMPYVEAYNFHNHTDNVNPNGPYDSFSVDKNNAHLAFKRNQSGGNQIPAWVTEAGGSFADSPNGLNFEKQRAQARYWVTSAAMSLATGVDKHFWFYGRELVEDPGKRYWGSFSEYNPTTKRITPYAAYAAQSAMTEALGEAIYLGKINNLPTGAQGHVFRDKANTGNIVLMLWANRILQNVNVALNLQNQIAVKKNIMGIKENINVNNGGFIVNILDPDPIYVKVVGSVSGYTAINHVRTLPALKSLAADKKIVLDQTFPVTAHSLRVKTDGYALPVNVSTTVEVTVYNFNETQISGTVAGSFVNTAGTVSPSQTVILEKKDDKQSKKTLRFTVTPTGTPTANERATLKFTGRFGNSATPSVVSVARVQKVR